MDKLTSLLVVVEEGDHADVLLDKAVFLARGSDARVDVLATSPALLRALADRCADRGYDEVDFLRAPDRALHECILARVRERKPDLVVKCPWGRHPLRRWTFDHNDWGLVADCPAPVLLCRQRQWIQPMRIAALVDVADATNEPLARGILQVAGYLTLGTRSHLEVLYSERELSDETLRMSRAVRLAALVREFRAGSQRMQILSGPPACTLPDVLAARGHDLVVIGAVTRHDEPLAALRSLTSRLVDSTDGDVLLVKASAAADTHSTREQVFHQAQEFA